MSEINHEIGTQRESGKLLKTGQTTQYGGYQDDGYFQKGLSIQYDVLTTGRYAGTTNVTLNAKTDAHSNNCVYDRRTKLMWSRYVTGSIGPSSNGKLPWTTNGDGEGIFPYAAAANLAALAGYSDWRIPNAYELTSLTDMEQPTGVPDATAFPSFPATYIWSSTTRLDATTNGIAITYDTAFITSLSKTVYNLNAILVRGG